MMSHEPTRLPNRPAEKWHPPPLATPHTGLPMWHQALLACASNGHKMLIDVCVYKRSPNDHNLHRPPCAPMKNKLQPTCAMHVLTPTMLINTNARPRLTFSRIAPSRGDTPSSSARSPTWSAKKLVAPTSPARSNRLKVCCRGLANATQNRGSGKGQLTHR